MLRRTARTKGMYGLQTIGNGVSAERTVTIKVTVCGVSDSDHSSVLVTASVPVAASGGL